MTETPPSIAPGSGRIPQLDGVRGLAILMVLLWHYFARQWMVTHAGASVPVAGPLLGLMWSGVDLFFVLSGFLIIGILNDNRDSPNYFRVFYLRRACRILPVYYLVLAAYLVVTRAGLLDAASYPLLLKAELPLWSYATFTQNIFMGRGATFGPDWLGVTWSLAVEEQFYLVAPLLLYLVPRRAFKLLCVVGIVVAPILRAAMPGTISFVNLPSRADSLLLGALLALMVRTPGFTARAERSQGVLLAFAALAVPILAALSQYPNVNAVLKHSVLGAVFTVLTLLALLPSAAMTRAFLARPALMWLGVRSYSIYLFHEVISGLVHGRLRGARPGLAEWPDALVTISALLLTLGLSELSYRFIEQPFIRFGHGFKYEGPPPPRKG